MNFLIFSDSHNRANGIRNAIESQPEKIDAIFFLGDGLSDIQKIDTQEILCYSVRGNCDYGALDPAEMVLDYEGHRILLCHGHLLSAKSGISRLVARGIEVGADIVLYGHTHNAKLDCIPAGEKFGNYILEKNMYLFNPGSIGYYGRSFGCLKLTPNTVLFSHGEM